MTRGCSGPHCWSRAAARGISERRFDPHCCVDAMGLDPECARELVPGCRAAGLPGRFALGRADARRTRLIGGAIVSVTIREPTAREVFNRLAEPDRTGM